MGFRIPQGVLPILKPRIRDSGFDKQKFRGFQDRDSLTRGACVIDNWDVMNKIELVIFIFLF